MISVRREPLGGRNTQPLPPNEYREREQCKQSHQHAKDTKRLCSPTIVDPSADEERPGERDDRTARRDCNEAIAGDGVVRFDQVVEADGWALR